VVAGCEVEAAGFGPTASGTRLPFAVTVTDVLPRFTRRCLPRHVRALEMMPSKAIGVPVPRSMHT
jgi:hypothetical protein